MFAPEKSKILTPLTDPELEKYGVLVYVKREDLVHPLVGGNKFRKLKYNFEKAKVENKNTIVTFGGPYSNHIAATAFTGKKHGLKTIGIIRGEKTFPLNSTLQRATDNGMELFFTDRATYCTKEIAVEIALKNKEKANCYIIPEGGSNDEGYKGCCEITSEISIDFDYICCPCGTGTTLAGIASELKQHQKAIGFSVLKNNYSLAKSVQAFLKKYPIEPHIFNDYHFGGYAKSNDELDKFIKQFNELNHIQIEPVYTGKMFYGIYDLIKKGFFKEKEIVIAIHTGGLQYLNTI